MINRKGKRSTEYAALKRKIDRSVKAGTLLCDIKLTDDQFDVLASHAGKCIRGSYPVSPKSAPLAVFLVLAGQRYYDGGYWEHVSDAVGFAVPYKMQQKLGDAFYDFAVSHGLTVFKKEERVRNIMAQVFLPIGFEYDFFSYLFYHYFVDLNCDISRLDVAFLLDPDEGARQRLVTRGTLDFIAANPKTARIRIRRMFSVMDRVFRLEALMPRLSASDMRLIAWCGRDPTFRRESKIRNFRDRDGLSGAFTEPYVENTDVGAVLWLPGIIFRNDNVSPDIAWYLDGEVISYPAAELSITGIKTEIVRIVLEKAPPEGSVLTVRCGEYAQSFKL